MSAQEAHHYSHQQALQMGRFTPVFFNEKICRESYIMLCVNVKPPITITAIIVLEVILSELQSLYFFLFRFPKHLPPKDYFPSSLSFSPRKQAPDLFPLKQKGVTKITKIKKMNALYFYHKLCLHKLIFSIIYPI